MTVPLLFVTGEYPPDLGGVGDYTARLRAALAAQGWASRVLSRRAVPRWDARSLVVLLRAAPAAGIVHIQFQAGAYDLLGDVCLMPWLLRRLRPRVKTVTTFHDVRVPYLFPRAGAALRMRAVQLLARTSDAVICAEASDLAVAGSEWFKCYQVPIGSNVSVLPPPGYDRAAFRANLGLAVDTLVMAYFGLLNASKGLDNLLEAFSRVLAAEPGARLLLLGGAGGASDPTDRVTAAAVAQRVLTFGPRIIRPGYLDNERLSAYLLAADVAVLPYADGASGRRGSLLACATHGLPIVTTLPATPTVVDAVTAVVPTPERLAEAVLTLHRDGAQKAEAIAATIPLVSATTWPAIAARHVEIYESLGDPAPAPSIYSRQRDRLHHS